MPTIAVTGAAGRVGGATFDALRAAGSSPLALVRDDAAAERLDSRGGATRRVDYSDPVAMERALAGVDRLLLCTSHGPQMRQVQTGMVSAAARAGVGRIVKISASPASIFPGTPANAAADHLYVEEAIGEGDFEAVFVRPNAFIEALSSWESAISGGVLPMPLGRSRLSWVDIRDVGAVAASLLVRDRVDEQVVAVTGPEGLTGDELAEILSRALGQPVDYLAMRDEDVEGNLERAGASSWLAAHVVSIFRLLREGEGGMVTDAVTKYAGRAPHTAEESVDHLIEIGRLRSAERASSRSEDS